MERTTASRTSPAVVAEDKEEEEGSLWRGRRRRVGQEQ